MTQAITIIKRNSEGKEVWRYPGSLLSKDGNKIVIEANFTFPDVPFMGIMMKAGDRFIETYYTDRWYNILEVHDRDDDHLKGWYCNITRPAVFEADGRLSYDDLALDLWVDPQGKQTVLDEDEFGELELDNATQGMARAALSELQELFRQNKKPGSLS